MKVANVHDVYLTEQALTVGIKTGGAVDEKAIRDILRKNSNDGLFPIVVPAEKAQA